MNEVANFCDGECSSTNAIEGNFDPDNPPYKPENGGAPLNSHTISLRAKQHIGSVYDTHNLYGHMEAKGLSIEITNFNILN